MGERWRRIAIRRYDGITPSLHHFITPSLHHSIPTAWGALSAHSPLRAKWARDSADTVMGVRAGVAGGFPVPGVRPVAGRRFAAAVGPAGMRRRERAGGRCEVNINKK